MGVNAMPQLTVCPECAEPLDPADKFCGVCGADLKAAAAVGGDGYELAPPLADSGGGDSATLAFGLGTVQFGQTRITDPREEQPETAPAHAVCVACGVGQVDADG
jgi:hypothetical protein